MLLIILLFVQILSQIFIFLINYYYYFIKIVINIYIYLDISPKLNHTDVYESIIATVVGRFYESETWVVQGPWE